MMLNFRAIAAGVVIDLVGSIAGGMLVLMLYASVLAGKGFSGSEIEAVFANPGESSTLVWLLLLTGMLFDYVAGLMTARMAGYLEYWHVLAMLGLLTVVQYAMGGGSVMPLWIQVTGFLGGSAAAFFGAWRVKIQRGDT